MNIAYVNKNRFSMILRNYHRLNCVEGGSDEWRNWSTNILYYVLSLNFSLRVWDSNFESNFLFEDWFSTIFFKIKTCWNLKFSWKMVENLFWKSKFNIDSKTKTAWIWQLDLFYSLPNFFLEYLLEGMLTAVEKYWNWSQMNQKWYQLN